MQLMIEVLPAPLGPMIENSSPSFTPKLTSESARTPPKRSDTPRTSKACSKHSLRNAHFAKADTGFAIGIRVIPIWRLRALRSIYQQDQAGSLRRVNRFVRFAPRWARLPG